jgi:hypothetical protein
MQAGPFESDRDPSVQRHTSGSVERSSADGTGGSTMPWSSRSGSAGAAPPADLVCGAMLLRRREAAWLARSSVFPK